MKEVKHFRQDINCFKKKKESVAAAVLSKLNGTSSSRST